MRPRSASRGDPSAVVTPQLINTRVDLTEALAGSRLDADLRNRRVAFVPTMGALHAGHGSLMAVARQAVGSGCPVVVSIFVNPLQFGVGEDLSRYPQTLPEDLALCAEHGVDIVYAPEVSDVYPSGEPEISIDPGPGGVILEGAYRPGHFRGVLTVVAKLFGLVRPDIAVFGEKDFQQLTLIRQMVVDLCLGVEVIGAPTMREPDGLALSSRNRFLEPSQRREAAVLNRALRIASAAASRGSEVGEALKLANQELASEPTVVVDYITITDVQLRPLTTPITPGTVGRVLVAARVGSTRLIDNLPMVFG